MRCLPPCLATCPPSQPPQSPSALPPWRPLCRIPLRPLASESLTPKAARGFCPLPTHSAHARHTARLRPSPPRAAVASQPNGLSFHLQAQARPRPPRCPQVMARQAEATDLPASILGERETLGGGLRQTEEREQGAGADSGEQWAVGLPRDKETLPPLPRLPTRVQLGGQQNRVTQTGSGSSGTTVHKGLIPLDSDSCEMLTFHTFCFWNIPSVQPCSWVYRSAQDSQQQDSHLLFQAQPSGGTVSWVGRRKALVAAGAGLRCATGPTAGGVRGGPLAGAAMVA